MYVAASLTDVLDGFLARRWKQTTPLGKVLDPLADIVFNLTMLAGLAAAGLGFALSLTTRRPRATTTAM